MSHATTPVFTGLSAVLARLGARLSRDLERASHGEARGVHRARVSLRRLREALALVTGSAAARAGAARRDARRLRSLLGPLRELDVVLTLLEAETTLGSWSASIAGHVHHALETSRASAEADAHAHLGRVPLTRLSRRIDETATAVDAAPRRDALGTRLAARLDRRARDLDRALRAAGRVYAPAPLHRVRIAAKKLRYTVELVRDLRQVRVGADLAALRRLQDALGQLHDRQTLQARIAVVEADASSDRVLRQGLGAMRVTLEAECRALHAASLREWPRATRAARRLRLLAGTMRRPRTTRMPGPLRVRTTVDRFARGA